MNGDGAPHGSSPTPSWAAVAGISHSTGSRRLPDPLVDADMDGVARLLSDGLAEAGFHRQPVRTVALRHQRAVERLAVDHAADLHEPARAEKLRRVCHHDARPRTRVVALLKLGVELAEHDTDTLTALTRPGARQVAWGSYAAAS